MVTVVIVDYKTPQESFQYIDRFIHAVETHETIHYVIVDNSGDEAIQRFCIEQSISMSDFPYKESAYLVSIAGTDVYVVDTHCNLGYAKGNNYGVQFAVDNWNDSRIIISNNDIFFPEKMHLDDFEKILQSHTDVAVVGPMVRSMDDKIQQSPRSLLTYPVWVLQYWLYILAPSIVSRIGDTTVTTNSQYVYWVTGCFMYIDTKKFVQAGMFDPETFLYCEEKILSERLSQHGYHMYFAADLVIHHRMRSTISDTSTLLKLAESNYDSAIYYYKKYRHINSLEILFAAVSFQVYKKGLVVRQKIKAAFKR